MGLAASQARLLTITSRKSDCEYQSMALSHQKIALARDMDIVSNEYQNALSKTKIVYDFYGNGDTSTPLSYNLLMNPSKLNDYLPTPVTDPSGRIVLDPALAAAAEAAGIPQEGLGCTPSSDIRNRFIEGLVTSGLITRGVSNSIKNVQYNPYAGFGTTDIITTSTKSIKFSDFINEYLSEEKMDLSDLTLDAGGSHLKLINFATGETYDANDGRNTSGGLSPTVTIKDLINGNYALYGTTWDKDQLDQFGGRSCIIDKVGSSGIWDILISTLGEVVNPYDSYTQSALDYAKQQTLEKVVSLTTLPDELDTSNAAFTTKLGGSGWFGGSGNSQGKIESNAKNNAQAYVGYVYISNYSGKGDYNDGYSINLTNMAKAFYTYFAAYMEGLASTDLKVTTTKATSNFVTDGSNAGDFTFDVLENIDTTGDSLLISNFYDTLFNQIAIKGWVSNDKVHDNEYLTTMLQNGAMYISSLGNDEYYYQDNYAANKYIKEINDDEYVAVAEAKYLREKNKINAKEHLLDMKMKNLDTEITALNTEYESIKSVISNNVKTGFTRYKA